jgi:hypothetical protein
VVNEIELVSRVQRSSDRIGASQPIEIKRESCQPVASLRWRKPSFADLHERHLVGAVTLLPSLNRRHVLRRDEHHALRKFTEGADETPPGAGF